MKISPVGVMVVALGALAGIMVWVIGFIGLPNNITHRDLAKNEKILSSAQATASESGSGSTTGTAGSAGTDATPWYALDKAPNTLDLTITAQTTTDNSGLNFMGYYNGALKITVPKGFKVNVTFANHDASMPHSVGFTDWAHRNSPNDFPAAFPGSIGPKFVEGIVSTDGSVKFSFTADKAGQYAFVCGVPGHAAGGMWDEFDVSDSAKNVTIAADNKTITVK
jgi:hypothetical protein